MRCLASSKALYLTGLFLSFLTAFIPNSSHGKATNTKALPRITIVIDDIGNNERRGIRTAHLLGPVTLAILPNRPFSKELAQLAHNQGKEVILHAPMENLRDMALGYGALTKEMKASEFTQQLIKNIDSIPHLMGVNNHMGSLLTTRHLQMHWTMKVLKDRDLIFLDSKTNSKSVAKDVALKHSIPAVSRDIFLDHERTASFISQQFEKCLRIAAKRGNCLMIGHPYPETLNHLEAALPKLSQRGFQQQSLSSLIKERTK
jgi:polysaccharide deacetylase 2 family uncharacterized protein YibQ